MQTIRVDDAVSPFLDWLVAKCEAISLLPYERGDSYVYTRPEGHIFNPSGVSHQDALRILSQHIFRLEDLGDYEWEATGAEGVKSRGESVQEAVCRAYVKVILGDEVEVPEEFT